MKNAILITFTLFLIPFMSIAQGGINWMTIEEAVKAQKKEPRKIIIDVYTKWCGPCKMIAPILDEVAGTYQGKLQIAKMNVDENREVPAKFGIRGIPTLMIFKDGQLAATKVGAMSKAQLTAFIDQQLA